MNKIQNGTLGNDCCVKEMSPLHSKIDILKEAIGCVEVAFSSLYGNIEQSGLLLTCPTKKEMGDEKIPEMSSVEYEIFLVTNRLESLRENIYSLRDEYRG